MGKIIAFCRELGDHSFQFNSTLPDEYSNYNTGPRIDPADEYFQ